MLLIARPGRSRRASGRSSLARHLRRAPPPPGWRLALVARPGLALDVDTPADLAAFCALAGRGGDRGARARLGSCRRCAGALSARRRGAPTR